MEQISVVQKYFDEAKKKYAQDSVQNTFNALIYGKLGTGKTRIARTCRMPVLIDSFDPGGTKTVKDLIDKGDIIANTSFEAESYKSPHVFNEWRAEMDKRVKLGVFNEVGTYFLDSATTWGEAVLNSICGPGKDIPTQPDYMKQQNVIRECVKMMTNLPCDFILTGHIKAVKDEITGRVHAGLLVTGRQSATLPLLFDEIYVTVAKHGATGVEYKLMTANDGDYEARTRIGAAGADGIPKFDRYEKPDIVYLLKKSGFIKV